MSSSSASSVSSPASSNFVLQRRRQRGLRHARGNVEGQLRVEFGDVLELGQRRQLVQALEAEVVEEGLGGAEQLRAARHVAVADHADPLALLERLDDVGVDADAADLFDLAARDRLAVGDQRQGLQRGARVLGLALGPQARHPGVHVGLHLEAEAGGHLDQFDAAVGAGFAQFGDAPVRSLPGGACSSSGNSPASWARVSGCGAASRAASTIRRIRVGSIASKVPESGVGIVAAVGGGGGEFEVAVAIARRPGTSRRSAPARGGLAVCTSASAPAGLPARSRAAVPWPARAWTGRSPPRPAGLPRR